MTFRITRKENDGLAEAPGIEVEAWSMDELFFAIENELKDEGWIGVGGTLTIERTS
jgi:hypothetical protein